MKINFTLWDMGRAGGTRAIFEVSNRLVSRGHDVVLTSLGTRRQHAWFPLKSQVVNISLPFPLRVIQKFLMRPFFGQWEYDMEAVLSNAVPECDINVATYCNTVYPVIRSNRGVMFYYIQHYEPLFFRDGYQRTKAKLTYLAKIRKLVVSQWLLKLITNLSHEIPTYISNGVDHKVFYPRSDVMKGRHRTVMSFFRGIPWKGEEQVLDAMNDLADRVRDVKLLGVGRRRAFKELVKRKSIRFGVEFVESPDDNQLAELYSSADLFVFPSWYEGFGLPPLEAMSCGTPVVAADCYGIADYAVHNRNALLVPAREPKKLSHAIETLLVDDELREKLQRNGLETSKKYSWDVVADNVERAFRSALDFTP